MQSILYSYLITFPFEQLGMGLRKLSLSGSAGNTAAIIAYILICLVPCMIFLGLKKAHKILKADFFLPLLSILLFAVIYFMVNPGLFPSNVPGTGRTFLGTAFYSVFWGYIFLRALEKYSAADAGHLQKGLKLLLTAMSLLLIFTFAGQCCEAVFSAIPQLEAANKSPDAPLTVSYVFLAFQCIIAALPYCFDVYILITAVRALDDLLKDPYSDASVSKVDKISSLCAKALVIAILSSIAFNIFQLLFCGMLPIINMVVSIPVFSAALAFAVLLTAKYVRENQRLKRDNELFI